MRAVGVDPSARFRRKRIVPIFMRGLKLPSHVQIGAERRRRGWAASIARLKAHVSLTRLCYILQGDSGCLVGNRAGAAADIVEYCVGCGFLACRKRAIRVIRRWSVRACRSFQLATAAPQSFAGHQPLLACDCWICCAGAQGLGLHARRKVTVMFPAPVEYREISLLLVAWHHT